MLTAKGLLIGLVCLPFVILLAAGAVCVATALFFIYSIVALAYPPEAEWSA